MIVTDLPILYQDRDVVIANKPSGLLVHRTAIDRHETRFALQMLRDQLGQSVYTVHRLDKPTSGALLVALSSETARALARSFENGEVKKRYLAIVRGIVPEQVLVDYPLLEEWDPKMGAEPPARAPQEAVTEFIRRGEVEIPEPVDRYPTSRYSLVEAAPRTGRRHQIRRHLRHLGHPIIGDVTYGVGKHNRFFETRFGFRRLFLAATRLEFPHPRTGLRTTVEVPLADDFRRVSESLGWDAR